MPSSFPSLPFLLVAVVSLLSSRAEADLIFDLDSPGVRFELGYHVTGDALAEFPFIEPEWIEVDRRGRAVNTDIHAFVDADDVAVFFHFDEPIDAPFFQLNEILLLNVPAFSYRPYRVSLDADNFPNAIAEGRVIVDTPHRLVLEIFAGRHWNIPALPDVTWGGKFLIHATRTPEPAFGGFLAAALVALAALSRSGKRSAGLTRGGASRP